MARWLGEVVRGTLGNWAYAVITGGAVAVVWSAALNLFRRLLSSTRVRCRLPRLYRWSPRGGFACVSYGSPAAGADSVVADGRRGRGQRASGHGLPPGPRGPSTAASSPSGAPASADGCG